MSVRTLPKVPDGRVVAGFYDKLIDLEFGQSSWVSRSALMLEPDGSFWMPGNAWLLQKGSILRIMRMNLRYGFSLLRNVPWPGYKVWRDKHGYFHARPTTKLEVKQRDTTGDLRLSEREHHVLVTVHKRGRLTII